MYYYIYQITNLVNNKIYVGVHKTKDLNDGYMGSGKVIKSAINKHGINNFKKDILEFFENAELMYAREKEIVTDDFLLREDTYNLRRGGYGGFDHINKNKTKEDWVERARVGGLKSRIGERAKGPRNEKWCDNLSKSSKGKQNFLGKTHSDKTKQTMKQSAIGKHDGEKNSQFGTMWITDGTVNKKIKKSDLIPDGWSKGRIIVVQ